MRIEIKAAVAVKAGLDMQDLFMCGKAARTTEFEFVPYLS